MYFKQIYIIINCLWIMICLVHCCSNHSVFISDGFCDFEEGSCDWAQEDTGDGDWVRGSGSAPVSKFQPSFDHTTDTDSGHYFFMNSSSHDSGQTASLFSPLYTAGTLGHKFLSFLL